VVVAKPVMQKKFVQISGKQRTGGAKLPWPYWPSLTTFIKNFCTLFEA